MVSRKSILSWLCLLTPDAYWISIYLSHFVVWKTFPFRSEKKPKQSNIWDSASTACSLDPLCVGSFWPRPRSDRSRWFLGVWCRSRRRRERYSSGGSFNIRVGSFRPPPRPLLRRRRFPLSPLAALNGHFHKWAVTEAADWWQTWERSPISLDLNIPVPPPYVQYPVRLPLASHTPRSAAIVVSPVGGQQHAHRPRS